MIDDDVVEAVSALGMSALGLYTHLERLVGKDRTWQVSITELSRRFNQSERYIQVAMNQLIEGGWVERVPVTNRFGMQMSNAWKLPFHRTYGGEPRGEPRGEPQVPSQFTPLVDTLVDTVDNVVTPPLSPKGERKRATRLSDDFSITPDMMRWAEEKGIAVAVNVEWETEKFRNYWQAKSGSGGTKLDWVATWRTWMMTAKDRSPIKPNGRHPHPTNKFGERIYGTEELLRMAEEMEGKTNDESGDCQDALDAAFRVVPR